MHHIRPILASCLHARTVCSALPFALLQKQLIAMVQVRLVFDSPGTTETAAQNGKEAVDSGSEGDKDDENTEASDAEDDDDDEDDEDDLKRRRHRKKKDSKDDGKARVQGVLQMLQLVSDEQVEEIAQVCRCAPTSYTVAGGWDSTD